MSLVHNALRESNNLRTKASGYQQSDVTLRSTNEIPIFVANPPFLRHEDGNSAILDGNLQSRRRGACGAARQFNLPSGFRLSPAVRCSQGHGLRFAAGTRLA